MQYDQQVLRRLQLTEMGMLEDIDRVCREHNITYFLDAGTLLGARRHGGFIPWDDDVDLGMPRDDYERFLQEAPEALGDAIVSVARIRIRIRHLYLQKLCLLTRVLKLKKRKKRALSREYLLTSSHMMQCAPNLTMQSVSVGVVLCDRASRICIIRST